MAVDVIVGLQRGDEGKGRFVDMLMPDYDIGARFNGGPNAGHTVVRDGQVFKLHGLPTSVVHEHPMSVIGNGAVVDPVRLLGEIATLKDQGVEVSPRNLLISGAAHFITPDCRMEDAQQEGGEQAQGSTKSGIAQAYAAKARRHGIQVGYVKSNAAGLEENILKGLRAQRGLLESSTLDYLPEDREAAKEFAECATKLGAFVTDTALYLNRELYKKKRVLAEGAQAFLLDLDHGMYPYTSSSSATVGGVVTGLGIDPAEIEKKFGVIKAIPSHVGSGPFVTEETDPDKLARLHGDLTAVDSETGTTTGRIRRLGYLDLPVLRRAVMINGIQNNGELFVSKLDWINTDRYPEKEVPICVSYRRKDKVLIKAPDVAYKHEQCTPIYVKKPVSDKNIQGVRTFEGLPSDYQNLITYMGDQLGAPITIIGVGPDHDQVIDRR